MAQMKLAARQGRRPICDVAVYQEDIMANDRQAFEEHLSQRITGTPLMGIVDCRFVGARGGHMIMRVECDVSAVVPDLEDEEYPK